MTERELQELEQRLSLSDPFGDAIDADGVRALIAEVRQQREALVAATDALEVLRRGHGVEVSAACYPALNLCRAALGQ